MRLLFGKYKGKEIEKVAQVDPNYLMWLIEQDFVWPEVKVTIMKALGVIDKVPSDDVLEVIQIIRKSLLKTGMSVKEVSKLMRHLILLDKGSADNHHLINRGEIIITISEVREGARQELLSGGRTSSAVMQGRIEAYDEVIRLLKEASQADKPVYVGELGKRPARRLRVRR